MKLKELISKLKNFNTDKLLKKHYFEFDLKNAIKNKNSNDEHSQN